MPWLGTWSTSPEQQSENDPDPGLNKNGPSTGSAYITALQDTQHGSDASSFMHHFTTPQTLLATAVLTTACLGSLRFYRKYLKRIPEAITIPQSYFQQQRSVFGRVTNVGDGDNFRLYHTPGGRLVGWGWLPWRTVPKDRKELKNQTIHVRLAGIDAPETSHFGRPAQPHAQESLDWLTQYLTGRRVRAYVHRADQYGRVVATAYVWKGILRRDVGLQMLKAGMAGIYEAKTGVEFGGDGMEEKYRAAEDAAKKRKKGMWAGDQTGFESPREYKRKYASTPEQVHDTGKDTVTKR